MLTIMLMLNMICVMCFGVGVSWSDAAADVVDDGVVVCSCNEDEHDVDDTNALLLWLVLQLQAKLVLV